MEAKAVLRYIRVAPRKARMAVDLIRGRNAEEAMTILKFTPRHAARVVQKILKSAVANATQKDMGDVDALRVSKVFVDVGPTMKRVLPRAMGRANTVRKRTSHITVVVKAETEVTAMRRLSPPIQGKKRPQEAVKIKAKAAAAKEKPKAEDEKKDESAANKGGGE